MRFTQAVLTTLTVAFFSTGIMHADTITVSLGASNQDFTLIGQGGSNGYGTYLAQQGACVAGSSLTTCILSGSYTGTTPGYDAGSYILTTTYNNGDGGLAATSTTPVASPDGGNYFNFDPFLPDVNMYLFLIQDSGGANAVPLVENGVFVADSYFIGDISPVCSSLPVGVPCTQGEVGLYNGVTFSGPIDAGVIFDIPDTNVPAFHSNIQPSVAPVPEPEWLALGGMIPGILVLARRRFFGAA